MARVAFIQNKLGKTDGVSLEVDKWRSVLEGLGHEVLYCAGNDDVPGIHVIPELSLFHPRINRVLKNGTVALEDMTEQELLAEIDELSATIRAALESFIAEQRVELIIPNNLQSVGYNIPAMKALYELIRDTGIPTIAHSHDFWWENSGEVEATCDGVRALYEQHSPPDLPSVRHVVINRLAQAALLDRKGITSSVVPNVFDFAQPEWVADEYNSDFRSALGLGPNDIVLLQATRVMDRKGIEHAVDLAGLIASPEYRARLEAQPLWDGRTFGPEDRVVLVCAGYVEQFGITGDYVARLRDRARATGADLMFAGEIVKHSRGVLDAAVLPSPTGDITADAGAKVYSLWDAYVHADFVTYPSWWEGWGNQFIEAVFARLPVVLYEYPVYRSDLATAGFDVVSLGGELGTPAADGLTTLPDGRLENAAEEMIALLQDGKRRQTMTDLNWRVANDHFSYEVLAGLVTGLAQNVLGGTATK